MRMSTPQTWLYQQFVGDVPAGEATCYLCGTPCPALYPTSKGIADTFNSHSLARCPSSSWLCAACQWYLDNKAGHPDFRKMSLMVWETGWKQWQRADMKADIDDALRHGTGEAVYLICSLSKKKHIALQAPLNVQGSRLLAIQVEEAVAHIDQLTWHALDHAFSTLLSLGHGKGEILSGNLHASTLRKHGQLLVALSHSNALAPYRGAAILDFLSYVTILEEKEKEETANAESTTERDGVHPSGGAAAEGRVERDRPGVQGEVPHGHLVASGKQRGSVRAHEQHAEQIAQQSLF